MRGELGSEEEHESEEWKEGIQDQRNLKFYSEMEFGELRENAARDRAVKNRDLRCEMMIGNVWNAIQI